MPAACFLQAGGTEGWEADLARTTAEGVGGLTPLYEWTGVHYSQHC